MYECMHACMHACAHVHASAQMYSICVRSRTWYVRVVHSAWSALLVPPPEPSRQQAEARRQQPAVRPRVAAVDRALAGVDEQSKTYHIVKNVGSF